jgi:hypothetical protein
MPAHRINRALVELHCGDATLARALSERTSRMHEHRIAPVLDRMCSELGGTDALVRIDQLEVDLGALAVDDFEAEFVAKLEQALRAALTKALTRRAAGDQRAQASLEILETFALTGGLPWWASRDGDVVAQHFARAVALAEAELVALLRRIANDPGALDRIARTCDPDALVALVERTHDGGQTLPRGVDLSERRMLLSALAKRRSDRDAAVRPAAGTAASARFARTAEAATPREQAADERAVDAAIRDPRDSPAGADDRSDDRSFDAAMRDPSAPSASADDRSHDNAPPATDRHPPDARAPASGDDTAPTDDASQRRQAAEQTSADRQRSRALGTFAEPPARPAPTATSAPHPTPAPSQRTAGDAPHTLPIPAEPTAASAPQALPVPPARTAATAPHSLPVPSAPAAAIRAARRSALARLDELYVDDAGLVILWPFLERFFVRTGVLGEDRRFFDEVAQQQAVALLEMLATADLEPLEFRLPLAKLLCGRPLESDFALERPLTPEQLAEGDHLLAAVIDRAPVLGEISIPSFRATFLARPGALGTRDGAWLLQVERQTHDVVLDRFPWSWGWVRLPWMPEPLRVEW